MEIAYSIGNDEKRIRSFKEFRKEMMDTGIDRLMKNDCVLYLYPSMEKTSTMMIHFEHDDEKVTSPDLVLKEDIQRLLEKHKGEKKNYRLVMTPRGVNLFYSLAFVNTATCEELRSIFKAIRQKLNAKPEEFFVEKPYAYMGYDSKSNFLYMPTEDIGQNMRNNMFGKDMSLYDRSYYEFLIDGMECDTVSRMQFFKSIMF